MTKKSRQKHKYLENEKSIFSTFRRPSNDKNYPRPESAPLTSKKVSLKLFVWAGLTRIAISFIESF